MKFVVLHDVDVTSGNAVAPVVIDGIINSGAVDDDVKAPLQALTPADNPFIKVLDR